MSQTPKTETHTNQEPIRQCPYCVEDADTAGDDVWEGPGRGFTFHVLNTSDDIHDEKYTLPDDFEEVEAPIVGYGDVSMEMPQHYNVDHRTRYFCDYCGQMCKGETGLNVHLSHVAGDEVHPEDAADRDIETFPSVEVDDEGNLVAQDGESLRIATRGAVGDEPEDGGIPLDELKRLRDGFMNDAQTYHDLSPTEAAERVDDLLRKYASA